jgi:hypothetical protein
MKSNTQIGQGPSFTNRSPESLVALLFLLCATGCGGGNGNQSDDAVGARDAGTGPATCGPVLWLKFHEDSGTVAHDSSGNGNQGLLDGAGWGAGQCGGAVDLSGSEDDVEVASAPGLDLGAEYTISLWLWLDDWDPGNDGSGGAIVTKHRAFDDGNGWGLWIRSRSPVLAFFSTGVSNYPNGTTLIQKGRWYHVASTGSRVRNQVTLFVNGNPEATTEFWDVVPNAHPVVIGREDGLPGRQIDGRIEDLRIYARALSPTEIANLAGSPCSIN